MSRWISKTLDFLSEYLAHRKGLLPMIGIFLVLLNFIFRATTSNWLTATDILLHLGIIIAFIGFMLAWAL